MDVPHLSESAQRLLTSLTATKVVFGLFCLLVVRFLLQCLYNIFLHPLRTFPGPKLWAATRLPWWRHSLKGRVTWKLRDLHAQYGPTIRIAPDELSYTSGAAWSKIYGQKKPEFEKALDGRGWAPIRVGDTRSMLTESQERHARLRRAITPAFSERTIREQETVIKASSNKMIEQLHRRCKEAQDMNNWYSLAAYDIISEIAFGEPAGCLDSADQPHFAVIKSRAKSLPWIQLALMSGLEPYLDYVMPKWVVEARQKHLALTWEKVKRRIDQDDGTQQDIMSLVIHNKSEKLADLDMTIMASTFIVAGSGTSAGGLTGVTYFLGKNPEPYKKLVDEVRNTFKDQSEITIEAVSKLKYLSAVIWEALRLYPPTPSTLPRVVPEGGQEIEGKFVPGGIAVGVNQFTAGHMEWNFQHARSFLPERWLDSAKDGEFANDDRGAARPFSYGPRDCIGKNIAWAEMRVILAKVLFNFDLELVDPEEDWWTPKGTYIEWEKTPLMLWLRPRHG